MSGDVPVNPVAEYQRSYLGLLPFDAATYCAALIDESLIVPLFRSDAALFNPHIDQLRLDHAVLVGRYVNTTESRTWIEQHFMQRGRINWSAALNEVKARLFVPDLGIRIPKLVSPLPLKIAVVYGYNMYVLHNMGEMRLTPPTRRVVVRGLLINVDDSIQPPLYLTKLFKCAMSHNNAATAAIILDKIQLVCKYIDLPTSCYGALSAIPPPTKELFQRLLPYLHTKFQKEQIVAMGEHWRIDMYDYHFPSDGVAPFVGYDPTQPLDYIYSTVYRSKEEIALSLQRHYLTPVQLGACVLKLHNSIICDYLLSEGILPTDIYKRLVLEGKWLHENDIKSLSITELITRLSSRDLIIPRNVLTRLHIYISVVREKITLQGAGDLIIKWSADRYHNTLMHEIDVRMITLHSLMILLDANRVTESSHRAWLAQLWPLIIPHCNKLNILTLYIQFVYYYYTHNLVPTVPFSARMIDLTVTTDLQLLASTYTNGSSTVDETIVVKSMTTTNILFNATGNFFLHTPGYDILPCKDSNISGIAGPYQTLYYKVQTTTWPPVDPKCKFMRVACDLPVEWLHDQFK